MLPNLYDVFMWHNELDFLEVRLNELEPVVNGFAVADANLTFTLRPKTSLLTPALLTDPRFSSFADRIVHLSLDISNVSSDDTWERERHTRRESLRSAVERFRPLPGDLFITGDGDEFVRSSTLNRLRRCKGWKSPRTLRSSFFYFSFESRADFDWPGPSLHRHPALPPWPDGESMRVGVDRSPAGERAAGWHCSWCLGSVAALADKMRSYSHTEHDTPHFTDPRHIVSSILLRRDPF
ncbi:glycosyl transferase, partial [Hyaloraphidium curvatum]